jgi:tetratricopeptide (TPR) repeat protein
MSIFGFSIPFPKVSLPKLDISLDLQADVRENADENKVMNLPFKEFEKYLQIAKNSYDHIESINNYDKALEIDPTNTEILNYKGVRLNKVEKYDDAIKCFNRALEINPFDASIWKNKGNVSFNLKNYGAALKFYNKALEIKPDYKNALKEKDKVINILGKISKFENEEQYGDSW